MWIARDKDETLCIFSNKPIKYKKEGCWSPPGNDFDLVFVGDEDTDMFMDIKWSDKEPREVIIKLKE